MNELTKAEQNALSVTYEVSGTQVMLDPQTVKAHLVRGIGKITDQEVIFFINLCRVQKLNPLTGNEVYLIKYDDKSPAQTVVGKHAYLKRMFEHPDYLCKEDGIVIIDKSGKIEKREGCCMYPGDELVGGWCRVHYLRGGSERNAYKEVSISEYNTNKSSWAARPATMINKVAVSQCAREAFPKDYEGLYSEDEMIASGAIRADGAEGAIQIDPDTGKVEDPVTTQEERQSLFMRAHDVIGDGWKEYIKQFVSERGLSSTAYMTESILQEAFSELDRIERDSNKG